MIYETPEIAEAIRAHRVTWGPDHHELVVDHVIEEAAELILALQKLKRAAWGDPASPSVKEARERVLAETADLLHNLHFLGNDLGVERAEMIERVSGVAVRLTEKLANIRATTAFPWKAHIPRRKADDEPSVPRVFGE